MVVRAKWGKVDQPLLDCPARQRAALAAGGTAVFHPCERLEIMCSTRLLLGPHSTWGVSRSLSPKGGAAGRRSCREARGQVAWSRQQECDRVSGPTTAASPGCYSLMLITELPACPPCSRKQGRWAGGDLTV